MTKEWNSWLLNSFLRVCVYTCLSQEHTLATVSATNDRSHSQGKRRGVGGEGGQSLWRHILKVVTTIQRMLQTGKKVVVAQLVLDCTTAMVIPTAGRSVNAEPADATQE